MESKEIMLAISLGAPKEAYEEDGFIGYSLEEINKPIQIFAKVNNFYQLPTFAVYNASQATDEEIVMSANQYFEHIYHF